MMGLNLRTCNDCTRLRWPIQLQCPIPSRLIYLSPSIYASMTKLVPTESDSLLPQTNTNNKQNTNGQNLNHQMQYKHDRERSYSCLGHYCRPYLIFILLGILAFVILFVSSVIKEEGQAQQTQAEHSKPYWKDKHTKHQQMADRALERLNNMTHFSKIAKPCETTILMVRHCEDLGGQTRYYQDDTKHCSYLGFERSTYLATLFGSDARWPLPSLLYGVRKGTNVRQYETLQPLSVKANLTITMLEFPGTTEVSTLLLQDIASGHLCHQVVIIAWKHAFIRDVATSLGCGQASQGCPHTWDDYDFDSVWELKYVLEPKLFRQDDATRTWKHSDSRAEGWMIYGSQTKQGFDPLAFSKQKYSGGDATNDENP
jgi:Na+-transporting methylmalonyl-CoA/oxaloacetate decarboxylase gamma subunit